MVQPVRVVACLSFMVPLVACVAIGPTIPIQPAPRRSQAAFNEDRRACLSLTDQRVQPVANRSSAAVLSGAGQATSTPADLQVLYNSTFAQCMAARGNLVAQPAAAGPSQPTPGACGLRGVAIPPGTPIQEINIRPGDQPTIGFSQARTVVARASVLSPPCHGTLAATRPIGFRYVSRKDDVGTDMFAIRACNAAGECSITGMVLTITE
jgi:hypothetical protein